MLLTIEINTEEQPGTPIDPHWTDVSQPGIDEIEVIEEFEEGLMIEMGL